MGWKESIIGLAEAGSAEALIDGASVIVLLGFYLLRSNN